MCAKSNPAELEVCQYCEARLKPLVIPSTPEEQAEEDSTERKSPGSTPSMPDFLMPDWLQSLRQNDVTHGLSESEEDEVEIPAWSEQDTEPEGMGTWLVDDDQVQQRSRDAEEEEETDSTSTEMPFEPEDADASDWLNSLRSRSHVEREDEGVHETPDWLEKEETESDEEVPEWLQRIRSRQITEEPQSPPPVPDNEASQFLAEIRGISTPEEETPTESLTPSKVKHHLDEEIDIPDWLAGGEASDAREALPELPDWLKKEAYLDEEMQDVSSFDPEALRPTAVLPPLDEEEQPQSEWEAGDVEAPVFAQSDEEVSGDLVVAPFTLDEETQDTVEEDEPEWLRKFTHTDDQPDSDQRYKRR